MISSRACLSAVIVEDDARTRKYLCDAIQRQDGMILAASFDRVLPAMKWLRSNSLHVLLTDLGLPDGTGIDLIRCCNALHPACDIMVITMFGDEASVLASIEAGASGYILKDAEHPEISNAIRDLRAGGAPMSPLIARKVLARLRTNEIKPKNTSPAGPQSASVHLTKREAATLDLIARGYTYEEVARLLVVSISTVQTHIRGIYGKLAVNSRSEAVYEAYKLGLLQDGLLEPKPVK